MESQCKLLEDAAYFKFGDSTRFKYAHQLLKDILYSLPFFIRPGLYFAQSRAHISTFSKLEPYPYPKPKLVLALGVGLGLELGV